MLLLPLLAVWSFLFSSLLSCQLPIGQSDLVIRHEVNLPSVPLQILQPSATISSNEIKEPSGLVLSRKNPGVFWVHNDSGDKARIFAIQANGQPAGSIPGGEVTVSNAQNVDWEDITADTSGLLYIGDCGNNDNIRQDLAVYVVPEPDPNSDTQVSVLRTLRFFYPEQESFPPSELNFDAEALFWARGKLFLLTKHRSDSWTTLYRFTDVTSERLQPLKKISQIDIKGMVTAADASPDGKELVVLTYTGVWLFKQNTESDDFFAGEIFWLPIFAYQCEGIVLADNLIYIVNEQKQLFQVPKGQLVPVPRE